MLTLAQQLNQRNQRQNWRNPRQRTDDALPPRRTHRQFGAYFTPTTVTEEAMRRNRRSLRHIFRETVPNSSSAGRRSAHCRGRCSALTRALRCSIHFRESIHWASSLQSVCSKNHLRIFTYGIGGCKPQLFFLCLENYVNTMFWEYGAKLYLVMAPTKTY